MPTRPAKVQLVTLTTPPVAARLAQFDSVPPTDVSVMTGFEDVTRFP